ncbi:hypothetical protein MXB_2061, partial [Myxobolus squamalis]
MWILKYRRTWEENTRLGLEKHPINFQSENKIIDAEKTKDDEEFSDSDNCTVKLVELAVDVLPDMIAGVYTTVEGFLLAFKESIIKDFGTHFGTSAPENKREMILEVLRQLDEMIEGRQNFTMILDDPTGNSFIK